MLFNCTNCKKDAGECSAACGNGKIEKAETIISQLEQAEAISMDVYKRLAAEATSLLKQCKDELTAINADNSPT